MLVYCDTNIQDANTGETAAMQITDSLNVIALYSPYVTGTSGSIFPVEI